MLFKKRWILANIGTCLIKFQANRLNVPKPRIFFFTIHIIMFVCIGGTKDDRPEARLLHPWVRRFVENEKKGDTPQYPESGEVKVNNLIM